MVTTNCTDTAGSALDYLEEFNKSFISISDNQSSYPAHLLTMFGMFFLKQPQICLDGALLPQLEIKHETLTTESSSSCICVPFLCTEFQSDCSAFNLCVVIGIQCLSGILSCGKIYKCIPVWRGRFQSSWDQQGIPWRQVTCNASLGGVKRKAQPTL